jgi:hypothetical protein
VTGAVVIGHAHDAALRIPGRAPAGDAVRAAPAGDAKAAAAGDRAKAAPAGGGVKAAPAGDGAKAAVIGEVARIEPAPSGGAVVHGAVLAVVHGADAAVVAMARGGAAGDAAYNLPAGAAVAVISATVWPLRAFVVRKAGAGQLVVAPLVARPVVAEGHRARGDAPRWRGEEAIAGLTTG